MAGDCADRKLLPNLYTVIDQHEVDARRFHAHKPDSLVSAHEFRSAFAASVDYECVLPCQVFKCRPWLYVREVAPLGQVECMDPSHRE
jgi:hypothetical protein